MIRNQLKVAVLLSASLMTHVALGAPSDSYAFGTCDQVLDGDTFWFVADGQETRQKVRLGGIDAPEAHQRFGSKAKGNLKILLYGKKLEIQFLGTDAETGNKVVLVDAEGTDPARLQAFKGLAWLNPDDFDIVPMKKIEEYDELIYEAQVSHFGLWKERNYIPPWEYREKERRKNRR